MNRSYNKQYFSLNLLGKKLLSFSLIVPFFPLISILKLGPNNSLLGTTYKSKHFQMTYLQIKTLSNDLLANQMIIK